MDYREANGKTQFILEVVGRTKYLVNQKDLAEIGFIDSFSHILGEQQEETNGQTCV